MLNRKSSYIILFALILCITGGVGYAQEEIFFLGEELGVGSRAMGMGGAYVGVADDYSAIYWNPAGLGQIRRMEVNVGFSHNKIVNNATFDPQAADLVPSAANTIKTEDTFSRLNSIGITMPVPTYQGSLVFAVGYNKVRDFDNRFEIEGYNEGWAAYPDYFYQTAEDYQYTTVEDNVYQKQSIVEKGSLNHFSFAASLEMQRNFFLGASVNFISGKDDYSMEFSEYDIYNKHNTYQEYDENGNENISDLKDWQYRQSIVSDIKGTNFKIGALYRFGSMLRMGATISTPTTLKIKETWADSWKENYDSGDSFSVPEESGATTYKIKTPYTFSFGASVKLLNFLFSGGADFQDWSQAEFLTDPPIAGDTKHDVNNRIAKDFKSVTKLHLGAEMYIPIVRAKVRAGWFQDPTPYRYANVRPDKEYLTAGASLMLDKQVMVDLSYQRGAWKRETIDNLTNSPALEDITLEKVVGTLSIRF